MATLAALKKKVAALEAQIEQVTKSEMGSAIAKIRKIMADFGVTLDHLKGESTDAPRARRSKVAAVGVSKVKGSKSPKYRDPATGVTWAGVGRAPAWIANASNRDDFLINNPAVEAASVPAPNAAGKSAPRGGKSKAGVKRAAPVKRAGRKMVAPATEAPVAPAKAVKRAATKAVAKKVVPARKRKAPAKKADATASSD